MQDPPHRPDTGRSGISRTALALAWLLAAAVSVAVLLIGASRADAGVYTVAQCHPGFGARHPDFSFTRTSRHYRGDAHCGPAGAGLEVTHVARATVRGRAGVWGIAIPPATELLRARMQARGRARQGHAPQLRSATATAAGAGGPAGGFARAAGSWHWARWSGAAAALQGRLSCRRRRCGRGEQALIAIRRILLRLRDTRAPRVVLGGSLAGGDTVRGAESLELTAADAGSGVRRAYFEVNGRPLASRDLGCSLVRGVALRLAPCPRRTDIAFAADTTGAAYEQGVNSVRACVLDLAERADANSACQTRRIRVDNACPVSGEGRAAHLHAHLEGDGARALARGTQPSLAGRLLDGSGRPIGGATVCVATTPRVDGAAERVLATPQTDGAGWFTAALPDRPSRQVRVAYWADEQRVSEQFLELRVPAQPRLRVRPRRTLRNGQRARFAVALPGPRAAHRLVSLQARAGGHWLRVRGGRTDADGRWRRRYRFHSTTGRRTYRFRVVVPRQAGYPYERGHSRVRRVRVRG